MRRKSDALSRRFWYVETIGAAAIETALQFFLLVEEVHNP